MEVVLLGTGSGDGWPNPFCECASCLAAAREPRGQTAALVDGTLLLDCGPEAPRAALRAGRSLAAVRHVLITHDHVDHFGPAALLWRQWARRGQPLDVVGPAGVIAECRRWLGAEDPVLLRSVAAGERLSVGSYDVRVLPGRHETETLLYDLSGPGGTRLLYATDTGPLPAAALDLSAGRDYDLVLLEETFGDFVEHGTGHLDLSTFPRVLADLRAAAAVTERTAVVAIHLSHHNPSPPELARRLSSWGARVVPDGTVMGLSGPSQTGVVEPQPPRARAARHQSEPLRPRLEAQPIGAVEPQARPAPRRVLVLGGARSGKSTEAERRLLAEPHVVYVATGGHRPDDPDWQARVAEHRARRPPGWQTLESTDLADLLDQSGPPLLVDCLTLWLTALLDEVGAWDDGTWAETGEKRARDRVDAVVAALRRTQRVVVLVSNEVGAGIVPDTSSGRRFRDELGRLNTRIAAVCDEVLLVVAGRVLPLTPRSMEAV